MKHHLRWMLAVAATAALAPALMAQCPTGSCGGGCPSSGPAPASRVDKPAGAATETGSAVSADMPDPAKVPAWVLLDSSTVEQAAQEKLPIVVYFPAENESSFGFYGEDLAKLSNGKAVFFKVPFTADRAKSPDAVETATPASRLLSDNPSRDFGIAVGARTLLVCDWFGNETSRMTTGFKAADIEKEFGKVTAAVEKAGKKLQKNYDSAKAAWDKKDRAGALKAIFSNFKEGLVGLEQQQNTISLYTEIMDAARATISEASEKGDKAELKRLSRELKGTDAASAADEALKKLG